MENNKVITLDKNNNIISTESFPNADAAYEYYTDSIRILNKRLPKNEVITIVRMRWDSVMTMETIRGTH